MGRIAGRLVACANIFPKIESLYRWKGDIENEPDDAQSLVRFLTYANQWDVEGLVATTSIHQQDQIAVWRIREILEAYGESEARNKSIRGTLDEIKLEDIVSILGDAGRGRDLTQRGGQPAAGGISQTMNGTRLILAGFQH